MERPTENNCANRILQPETIPRANIRLKIYAGQENEPAAN